MIDQHTGSQIVPVYAAVMGFGPIYEDNTYFYYGEAATGKKLTDESWSVSRQNISTGYVEWANNGKPNQPYTNLIIVAALDFT